MAKAAPGKTTAPPVKPSGGGRTRLITLLVIGLPVVGLLLPSVLLLAAMALPTLAAAIVDRRRERYLTLTVGLLNLSGTLPALWDLWAQGQTYRAALAGLLDPLSWLAAYGGAGAGWLIYLVIPPFVATYYALLTQARLRQLRRRQQQLIEAWGEEVAAGHEILQEADAEAVPAGTL